MRRTHWIGMSALPVQAYIFDNDGTLVDTESVWMETYRRLLQPYGGEHDLAVHRRMMGLSPRACVEVLQSAHAALPQGEKGMEMLLGERRRLFQIVRGGMGIHPLPGVCEFLRSARDRGILLAMATSASREDIETQLEFLGWKDLFSMIVTAEDVSRHKPAPDVYLETARRLGVEPSACLAFEDAANGLLSARDAGMSVVFVRDTRFHVAPPFNPALTVASFEDLLSDIP